MKSLAGLLLAVLLTIANKAVATEIDPGPVSGNWNSEGNPYNVNGEIIISPGDTLTVEPGVEIIFQGLYKFIVQGWLLAGGAEGDSILFNAADELDGWCGIRFESAPDSSRLSYCIIEHGMASGVDADDPDGWGGGILCYSSNPVITHCDIRYNTAQFFDGGIAIVENSNPRISHCFIHHNIAFDEGGIGILSGSNPIINNCVISTNAAGLGAGVTFWQATGTLMDCTIRNNLAGAAGGGVYIHESNPTITGCDISSNSSAANWNGGGFWIGENSAPIIDDCTINNNLSGSRGGGIRIVDDAGTLISNCTISSNSAAVNGGAISCDNTLNTVITNCIIDDNSAGLYGGGLHLTINAEVDVSFCEISGNSAGLYGGGFEINTGADVVITNCTVADNTANESGGGISIYQATAEIRNSIIAFNEGDGIYFYDAANSSITYTDFNGNEDEDFTGDIPTGLDDITGTNANGDPCDDFMNIYLDPLFVDLAMDDFNLQILSPCIDAGDPDSPYDPDETITDQGCYYFDTEGVVAKVSFQPETCHLYQNYPNPFNPTTIISFYLNRPGKVELVLYDISGSVVTTLVNGPMNAGSHEITFDAGDLSSGVYLYQLTADRFSETKRMLFVK